jgi:thioredoxin-like negative regulator of GroEL
VNGVQQEFEGRVGVYSLNVADEENLALQQSYDLRGHPTAVVLDADGVPTERFFGAVDADTLREAVSAVAPETERPDQE